MSRNSAAKGESLDCKRAGMRTDVLKLKRLSLVASFTPSGVLRFERKCQSGARGIAPSALREVLGGTGTRLDERMETAKEPTRVVPNFVDLASV